MNPPGSTPLHVCFIAMHIYPVLAGDTRIAFVGGAEVQQSVQMRALRRAGCRVSVLTRDHGQPAVVDCDGIEVHRVPDVAGRGWPLLRFLYPRMTDMLTLLRRLSPDVVFLQATGEQAATAALYARLHHRRFVFAGASDPDFRPGPLPGLPPQHAWLYRMGLRAADAVIVQNMAQLESLRRHHRRAGHLIQNGYAEQEAQPGRFDGHVLWAATVKQLKRPELFVELARRLPHRRFVMVGGPGLTPDAQLTWATVRRAALALPNLELTGHVAFRHVGRHFDGAALSVNTSDYEGLPNTFMQAWLRGVPTLSFVRPESAPGRSGTIACRHLDDMARRAEHLLSDASAWQAASTACRRFFDEHHTLERAVERYLDVFGQPSGRRAQRVSAASPT
jgi:glycosyltransferase involved in cell wall biosynthesis